MQAEHVEKGTCCLNLIVTRVTRSLHRELRQGNALLQPGGEDAGSAAAKLELVGAVGEVAQVELVGAEIFDEAEVFEFTGDFRGCEPELEGFAGLCDAGGKGVEGELLDRRKDAAGLAVIKDEAAASGLRGDKAECRAEGFEGEIRDDA